VVISKELLSLILGVEVGNYAMHGNYIKYENTANKLGDINNLNLDTLGRLCKEWCLTQRYQILSELQMYGAYAQVNSEDYILDPITFKADTELEAIIKATEFVAREKV